MSANFLQLLIIAISFLVNIYIIFNFCERMFNKVYQNQFIYIGTFVVLWILTTCLNLFGYTFVNFAVYTFIALFVGIVLYGASKGSDILSLFLLLMFIASVEVLVSLTMSLISSTHFSVPIGNLTLEIIVFFSYQIVMHFIDQKKFSFKDNGNWATLVVFPSVSLYLIFSIFNLLTLSSTYTQIVLAVSSCILIFAMNIMFFFLFSRMAALYQKNEQNNVMEQQRNLQARYYRDLEHKYESSRKLYHDIKNHLNTLENLYEIQSPTTKEYSSILRNRIDELFIPQTRNKVLNVLLSDRLPIAQTHNISFKVNCEEIGLSFISEFDLTTILANLLDNAFDECINNNLAKNQIEFSICQINCFVVFLIENTCGNIPEKRGSRYVSKKSGHMGLGLLNVQEVVENKYNGTFTTQFKNNLFSVQITFSGHDDIF